MGTGTLPAIRQPSQSWAPPDRPAAVLAGVMAFWAYAGGVGLTTGELDPGPEVTARLPAGSTILAGVALLLVVAVPMTVACVLAWHGDPWAAATVIAAGLALVGWIAVEVLVIRSFSWLQPACLVYGLLLARLGVRDRRR